jgi:hypothetical protein
MIERYEISRKYPNGIGDVCGWEDQKKLAFNLAKRLSAEGPHDEISVYDRLAHHRATELWIWINGEITYMEARP